MYLLCMVTILLTNCSESKQVTFDSQQWKSWEESEDIPSLRWYMTEDLLENERLNGMTEERIIKLLGPPEGKYANEWNYFLGHTGRGIDTGTLFIRFNDQLVIGVRVSER